MGNESFLKYFSNETELWSPSKQMKVKPYDVLANKVVLLYFSAQWCGPCARFTPVLIDLYNKLKKAVKKNGNNTVEDFEIVFCSLDRTQDAYEQYTSKMPWLCLQFHSPIMGKLANMYGNVGNGGNGLSIPLLIIINNDGTIISTDGVSEVSIDPDGTNFPWRPQPINELLPKEYLVHSDSTKTSLQPISNLRDKYLMLYFSAHWCPPCKAFTPKLSAAYKKLKEARSDFELLFVSSDRDQATFDVYWNTMSFGALPFEDREAKANLSKRLQVRGIPTLVIFGPTINENSNDRKLINANLRGVIESGEYINDFPYRPKQYGSLNRATDDINTKRCIIIFHENGDDEEHETIRTVMQNVCEKHSNNNKNESNNNDNDNDIRFYWALEPTGLCQAVRDALKLGPINDEPIMVLLDIPDQGSYYKKSESFDITEQALTQFLKNPGEKLKV